MRLQSHPVRLHMMRLFSLLRHTIEVHLNLQS